MKTHYDTLGVTARAEDAAIEGAYKALIKRYHPDKRGPDAAADDEKAKAINEAYRILRDPEKRARYDRMIGLGPSPEFLAQHDENGDLHADPAGDIDDRPVWISLGFIVLAALVIAVVAQVSSERWLSTHRDESPTGPISASSIPAADLVEPADFAAALKSGAAGTVSYTHLTLPTIYSV